MESLEYCARQAVNVCGQFKPEEKVTIIYDNAARGIADEIMKIIPIKSMPDLYAFTMEHLGSRPEDGSEPLKFSEEMRRALLSSDLSFFIAGKSKKGEYESFRRPMLDTVMGAKTRHIHMPGITLEGFLSGMSGDYKLIKSFTADVKEIVEDAKTIRVTTPRGSDFIAAFGKYKWVPSDGFPTSEVYVNLPDGEVFTTPTNLRGKVVVDGTLGDWFDDKYGIIYETPLHLGFENSRVRSIQCRNKELEKDFIEYIQIDENANRIGEFAIGTNRYIENLMGNMLHDEKFPGVHIAIGDPLGGDTGAEWTSKAHCDMVMKNCTIYVEQQDGEVDWIMQNGKFPRMILPKTF